MHLCLKITFLALFAALIPVKKLAATNVGLFRKL